MAKPMDLIDQMVEVVHCDYPSNLHSLNVESRQRLAAWLQMQNEAAYPLSQWNDALAYLVGEQPQTNGHEAKKLLCQKLLEWIRRLIPQLVGFI